MRDGVTPVRGNVRKGVGRLRNSRLKVRTNPWQSASREPASVMRAATRGTQGVSSSRKWLVRRKRQLGTSVIPLTNETLTCKIDVVNT